VEAGQGKAGGGVIEGGAGPVGRGMARGTVLREAGRQVGRIGGAVVIGLMAIPAGAAGQAVIAVHVALGARHGQMEACQSKTGGRVIERSAGPVQRGSAMAQRAILGKTGGLVGRIGGAVVIGLMAIPARRAGEAVVVIDMALRALYGGVDPGQGEARSGVIERGTSPIGRGVAARTVLREAGRLVWRVGGAVVIGLVAIPTGRAGQAVIAADVALRAL